MPNPDDPETERDALRREVNRLTAELAELRERASMLEALAHEDLLTGLLNRRGFIRELARALAFSARYGTSIALLLADLDGFKSINDAYGHEAGDAALVHTAALLRGSVRASDSTGRLGGDEFGIILWHADEALARRKALALEALLDSTPVRVNGCDLAVGSSIGAAQLDPLAGAEEVLARADRAMYERKRQRKAGL